MHRSAAILTAAFLAVPAFPAQAAVTGAGAAQPRPFAATAAATSTGEQELEDKLESLEKRLEDLHELLPDILVPFTVLVGTLTAGGIIGVVFSFREQRRISQLHELGVSSELSAQRRTEQSYNTFLEGSQKTLTLVNDTLTLAKEASEQAAHAMERKAGANLLAIERSAEDLVLGMIETGDFEVVLDIPEHRAKIQALVKELGALEGYRVLQEVELMPYSRFVTGIELYLRDDAKSARQTLRHGAQDSSRRQLQRFAQYWTAKLSAVFGEYDHARTLYEQAKEDAAEDNVEHWQLERVLLENEFLKLADGVKPTARPVERLNKALHALKQLELVADALGEKASEGEHATHEVAATRADIYTWIAHRPSDLFKPLVRPSQALGESVLGPDDETLSLRDERCLEGVRALGDTELRIWSIEQARRIYQHQRGLQPSAGIDFALAFGQAECHFALGDPRDVGEYRDIEEKARDGKVGAHREYRWGVGLRQISLICKARLLYHVQNDPARPAGADQGHLKAEVENAYTRLLDALEHTPDHELRYFSRLQRRNLAERDLREEARKLRKQALPFARGQSPARP